MADARSMKYAETLSSLIQCETVSFEGQTDKTKFYEFHDILRATFPNIFAACEFEDFNGSFLLRWKGAGDKEPLMLMNHHDVVEGSGEWKYPAFSGTIAEEKVWGRGTLDTKGGLFAMLQAADELAAEGFVPPRDVYFESACTEEVEGTGADTISQELQKRGIRFFMVLDEGGMIVDEPMAGVDGRFAMVGVGEKGCADLKFIARSNGGHASTPAPDSPLVRLGKFMAAVEKSKIFKPKLSSVVRDMFKRFSPKMHGALKLVLGHPVLFKGLLIKVMPKVSPTANAFLRTTLAFTMCEGSGARNVLPQEAYVIGNMRYSHHQGGEKSIEAVRKIAKKYDIEVEVLDPGFPSGLSSRRTDAYKLLESAVKEHFPGVSTSSYIMTGASDCRFMSRVSDRCLRFTPFSITDEQLESIHAVNENVDIACLAQAVDFYKYIIEKC